MRAVFSKSDRVGDFVLAIGAVRTLTRTYGEERCVLIVSALVEPLARRVFPSTRILVLPEIGSAALKEFAPFYLRARRLLRSVHFERLVCLRHQRTTAYNVLIASLSYRKSFGVETELRFLDEAARFWQPPALGNQVPYPIEGTKGRALELEAHRRVVQSVLERPVSLEEVTPVIVPEGKHPTGALILCPFGSSKIRDFPEAGWLAVFDTLSWRGTVLLCGTSADEARLKTLAEALCLRGLAAQVQPTPNLDALIQTIADGCAVVGVESAPAHIATAMDKPGVFLIGGGHWKLFAPWERSHRQIWLTRSFHASNATGIAFSRRRGASPKFPLKRLPLPLSGF